MDDIIEADVLRKNDKTRKVDKTSKVDNLDGKPERISSKIESPRQRWLVLVIFSLSSLMSAFHWLMIGIIPDIASQFFGVSVTTITWTTTTYMVVYCVLFLIVIWIIDVCRLKTAMILANGLLLLGAVCKMIAAFVTTFWVYEVGQVFCAIAEIFYLILPAALGNTWFPDEELSTAIAITVFGNQLGIGFSTVFPPYIITGKPVEANATDIYIPEWDGEMTAAVKLQFIYFTAVVCIIGLILFIAALLSPDHPDHFPSKAAKIAERSKERHMLSNNEKETKTRFTDSILQTFRKGKILLTGYPSYIALSISNGMLVGVYYALMGNLSVFIGQNLDPSSLINISSDQHVGLMGLALIIAGGVGSVITGQVVDRTRRYKIVSSIVYASTLVIFGVFTGVLHLNILALHYVLLSLLGLFILSYIQIGYEFAVEITWPVPESLSAAFNNFLSMILGAVLTPVMAVTLQKNGTRDATIVLLAVLAVGFIFNLCVTEQIRRPKTSIIRNSQGAQGKNESDSSEPVFHLK